MAGRIVFALLLQAMALDSATQLAGRHGTLLGKLRDLTEPDPLKVKIEVEITPTKKEATKEAAPSAELGPLPEAQAAPPDSGAFVKGALHRAILGHRKKMKAIVEAPFDDSSTEKLVAYVDHKSAESSMDGATPEVTADKWRKALDNVVGTCETRYIGSTKCIDKVVAGLQGYIKEATPKQAVSEIEDFPIHVGGVTEGHNIITRIPGEEPDKLVIVGAHYDSIPARGPAQGAEDNGSGVATLLAVAEAVKNTPGCCKYSVEFIMFSGEEEGLLGSSAFVKDKMVGDAAQKVHGVIIMDEVAYARPERNHARHLIFETSGHSKDVERVIDTMAHAAQVSNKRSSEPDVLFEINYDGFASDHMSFLNRGIPAVLVIERDNMYYASKYGHTSRDTVANIDNGLGASVATIVAQATANLAGAKR